MTAHKHAALMLQYAQDAAETDKPWERWEFRSLSGQVCRAGWDQAMGPFVFYPEYEYRRKPQPLECWVVLDSFGDMVGVWKTEESATSWVGTLKGRIVHFREVME